MWRAFCRHETLGKKGRQDVAQIAARYKDLKRNEPEQLLRLVDEAKSATAVARRRRISGAMPDSSAFGLQSRGVAKQDNKKRLQALVSHIQQSEVAVGKGW